MGECIEEDAESVIHSFHDAAVRAELWPAALQKLADAFEADWCGLIGGPNSSIEPVWSSSLPQKSDNVNVTRSDLVEDFLGVERILLAFETGRDIVAETGLSFSLEPGRR